MIAGLLEIQTQKIVDSRRWSRAVDRAQERETRSIFEGNFRFNLKIQDLERLCFGVARI